MDIALRRSEGLFIEAVLGLLPYVLAALGAYVLFTAWRAREDAVAYVPGVVLLAAATFVALAPGVLAVRLGPDAIEVRVVTGTRRFTYTSLRDARIVEGRLIVRFLGAGIARYHTGVFLFTGEGRVRVYASAMSGRFVLIRRASRLPLVLSPADPEAFLEAFEAIRGETRAA